MEGVAISESNDLLTRVYMPEWLQQFISALVFGCKKHQAACLEVK